MKLPPAPYHLLSQVEMELVTYMTRQQLSQVGINKFAFTLENGGIKNGRH